MTPVNLRLLLHMNIKETKEELEALDSLLAEINARIPSVERAIDDLNKKLERAEERNNISVGDILFVYSNGAASSFEARKYIVKVMSVDETGFRGDWHIISDFDGDIGVPIASTGYFTFNYYEFKKMFN